MKLGVIPIPQGKKISSGLDPPSGREGAASRTPAARNGSHLSIGNFHLRGVTTGSLHTLPSWSPQKNQEKFQRDLKAKSVGDETHCSSNFWFFLCYTCLTVGFFPPF